MGGKLNTKVELFSVQMFGFVFTNARFIITKLISLSS